MAAMVWCQSCKTVVWAYDHQRHTDLRGVANMWRLPCPQCGARGNYDGWGAEDAIGAMQVVGLVDDRNPVVDDWSAMRAVARRRRLEWAPSPDNVWRLPMCLSCQRLVEPGKHTRIDDGAMLCDACAREQAESDQAQSVAERILLVTSGSRAALEDEIEGWDGVV